jgi:hypothetical protein
VLWLKEETLKDQPLHKLSWPIRSIIGQQNRIDIDTHIKIIGPYASDTLKDMVNEARIYDVSNFPELRNVQFYVYSASASDRQLLNKANDTVRTYFHEDFDLRAKRTGHNTKQQLRKKNRPERLIFLSWRPILRVWSGRLDRVNSIIFGG